MRGVSTRGVRRSMQSNWVHSLQACECEPSDGCTNRQHECCGVCGGHTSHDTLRLPVYVATGADFQQKNAASSAELLLLLMMVLGTT